MPVQINEVIIRAVVDTKAEKEKTGSQQSAPRENDMQHTDILEKVIAIIKEKNER